jgi:hypothetical protein
MTTLENVQERSGSVWVGPAWLTVLRDLVCLGVGAFLVIFGALTGADIIVFMVGTGLMGGPVVMSALWLGRAPTESPSPPSASLPSSPSLPQSSPPSSSGSGVGDQ